ncbi:MAG: hypothetical protein IJ905_03715 [Fibrobacter sp.]|nr:hypothetical protein [Fibrobacter sp.]MBR6123966.1 hypothetical protein [Candidatus Saccharibacteria bacterium]
MKVSFLDKKVWVDTAKVVSIIAGVLTTILAFAELNACVKHTMGIVFLLCAIIIYLVVWYKANTKTDITLKIRNTTVTIKFGNIFNESGKKLINFNEYFDTQVDDVIIAANTLNGIIVNQLGANYIDTIINKNRHLQDCVIEQNCNRKQGGKTTKFKLGTICPCDEYLLVAFSQFDENDKAFHTFDSYVSCLMNMWNELDICYALKPIVTNLPGSGITRFRNEKMTRQELLETFIWTFVKSKVDFCAPSSLTIVLPENIKNEINLYKFQGMF